MLTEVELSLFKRTEVLTDEMFDKLFEHFCFTGEMPYGVAKARTGDPHEWITNKLKSI